MTAAHPYRRGPAATGVDMTGHRDLDEFLGKLRSEGDWLLILVQDSASETGWRIVPEAELAESWQSVESGKTEGNGGVGKLCYNVIEAARSVGVSTHKLSSWLRRAERPLPHIQDGRRILIPCHLLVQWLTEEAVRNVDIGEH